jgi:hypothetical protein
MNYQRSTDWIVPVLFFITTLHGPHRKHRSSIVACVFVSAGTCLPNCCSETAVCLFVYCIATAVLVCFEVLPSNGSVRMMPERRTRQLNSVTSICKLLRDQQSIYSCIYRHWGLWAMISCSLVGDYRRYPCLFWVLSRKWKQDILSKHW